MKNKHIASKIYTTLVMLFLYLPIFVLIIFSFNEGKTTVWKGFSFKWYEELFRDDKIINALGNSLIIVATVLGTAAAIGISNFKGKKRLLIQSASNIPIISPDIVMGVSLMLLFTFLGVLFNFEMGFVTVLIAHICFVVLNVMPRIHKMDQSIYDAALDLGCNQWQAFYKVVIHELMPGIFSGLLMSFTYSLDDFIITYFTRGAKFQNLSIEIYSMTHRRISPKINALSALLFLAVLIVMILINIRDKHEEKVKK